MNGVTLFRHLRSHWRCYFTSIVEYLLTTYLLPPGAAMIVNARLVADGSIDAADIRLAN